MPDHPRGYVCPRADGPVPIDGDLSHAVWDAAPWTDDFVDILGGRGRPPWLRTRVKMLWDDTAFYVGAELEEPHLWATLTDHDAVIFQDNDFEVFIDPDGDQHQYFEFEVNAFGTTWDLFLPKPYRAGGDADNGWELPPATAAVKCQGSLNDPSDADQGWTVTMAFPWASFAYRDSKVSRPEPGDQWRVNFSRVQWDLEVADGSYRKIEGRPEHNWVWSPQGFVDMHRPALWGYVQFVESTDATFREDPEHQARMTLVAAFDWMLANRKGTRWPTSLPAEFASDVTLERGKVGWQVSYGNQTINHEGRFTPRTAGQSQRT